MFLFQCVFLILQFAEQMCCAMSGCKNQCKIANVLQGTNCVNLFTGFTSVMYTRAQTHFLIIGMSQKTKHCYYLQLFAS